jgi:EmrB/QacA subfamily drug resistance transporter
MGKGVAAEEQSYWLPLFIIVIGAFAAVLNNSSVNVAIPKLMNIFGVSTNEIQWVLTSYTLTSGVVIPACGFLGDRFGNKRVYITALGVFTIGSVLCSLAWSNNSMVAFRVLQALGGGIVMPVSMVIIYKMVPMEKIGLAIGVWGMAAVMGPAIGPTLGGYIIDHFSWRLLFLVNVPVGIIGITLSWLLLKETSANTGTKFDLWGFLLSTTGCVALLMALSQGSKEGWTSYYIVMLFTLAFFALLLFVLVELFTEDPLLNLRLLKNMTFTFSVIVSSLITIALFGGVFLMPLFTQNLLGLSPYDTGLLLLPASLVTGFMLPISGILFDRFGVKAIGIAGLAITGAATLELDHLSLSSSHKEIVVILAIRSFGMGLSMMPVTTAGMNVVARHLTGRASALNNVIRQIAASFGIAFLSALMQNRQNFHYSILAEKVTSSSLGLTLFSKQLQEITSSSSAGSSQGITLAVIWSLVQKQSLVNAINDTFLVSSLFIFIAIPMIFFLSDARKAKKPLEQGAGNPSQKG